MDICKRSIVKFLRRDLKKSYKEIKEMTGVSYSFIHRWASRESVSRIKTIKSARKATQEVINRVEALSKNIWSDQGGSLRSISRKLRRERIFVSHMTVKRILDKFSWGKPRRYQKQMKLSDRIQKDRYKISKKLIRMGYTNDLNGKNMARNILYCDEKTFYLHSMPNRKTHVMRTDNQSNYISYPKFEFEKKVKVAAGISYMGKTRLIEFDGKLSSASYRPILDHFIEKLKERNRVKILLHDKDVSHYSKETKTYLKTRRIKVLPWMTSGADANVIEVVWAILHNRVFSRCPETVYQLKKYVFEEWEKLSIKEIRNCINTFPKRLAMIKDAKGKNIRYK